MIDGQYDFDVTISGSTTVVPHPPEGKYQVGFESRMQRRSLIVISIMPLISIACPSLDAFAVRVTDPSTEPRYSLTSGDRDLDLAIAVEFEKIYNVVGVSPGVLFFDQLDAYAEMKPRFRGHSDGTVYLGLPLIKKLMADDKSGAALAGVCAHECGIIYQFKRNLLEKLKKDGGVIYLELHADFIAGYYIGKRPGGSANDIQVFSSTIQSLGDTQFASPFHHGTGEQRVAAVEKGYHMALAGATISQASNIGLSYVMDTLK